MSSPAKNQPHTPTLNSLLRQPSAINAPNNGPNVSQQSGGNCPGSTYTGTPYSPGLVSGVDTMVQQPSTPSSQLQGQSDTYYNNRIVNKGTAAGNNYVPDGAHGGRYAYPTTASPFQQPPAPHHQQHPPHTFYGGQDKGYAISGYPQSTIANGPQPNSPRPAAPVAGQLPGQNKQTAATTSSGNEPMVNGVPTLGKGATLLTGSNSSQGDSSASGGPKHPSVAALRQEASVVSPAGARNASPSPVSLGPPASPGSLMRHSPVSPAPVSVYNQTGAYHVPTTAANQFGPVTQQHPPHGGTYDGNYTYGGFGHATQTHQGPPATYGNYTGSSNFMNGPAATPSNVGQPYFGQPPFGVGSSSVPMGPNPSVAQGAYGSSVSTPDSALAHNPYYGQPMKNTEPGRSADMRASNGPVNSYPPSGMQEAPGIAGSPAITDSGDSGKDTNRNGSGANFDNRYRTATPGTSSGGKIKINGAKESHPSTPVPASPSGASAEDVDSSLSSPSWPRTPLSPALRNQPASMGPPSSISSSASGSGLPTASGPGKDSGATLVARLLGDPVQLGCSPQEWNERRGFYERLVQFCESNGHPITAQPTVSKQTVDLFRLYMAVRHRGGFAEVTKKKLWKELCTMFGISQSNSASGQLKKQYSRFIFPFECYYDMHGIDPQPILASLESKKKAKAKNAAAAAAVAASAGQGTPQPRQMIQGFPQQQQPQHFPGEQFMGPPPIPYSASMDNANVPLPNQQPANTSGGMVHGQHAMPYAQMQHRSMVHGQRQQPAGSNELGAREPFDDRAYYPPSGGPPMAASPSSSGAYGNAQRVAAYPGPAYPVQSSTTSNVMISTSDRPQPGQMRDPMTAGDGQPGPAVAPAQQFVQPSSGQSSVGVPTVASAAGQSGYSNSLASPSSNGYQPVHYSHDSGNSNASVPPNQYITPPGPRYHNPASSTSGEIAPPSGMISHPHRSSVPTASFGPGMYNSTQQPSAPGYLTQSQQMDSSQQVSAHGYPAHPPSDNSSAQSAPYAWPNQRYPHPGPQRFVPASGAVYSQTANLQNVNADYSKVPRAGPVNYLRPSSYPSGPPTGAPPYGNVPPNMSLRPDLGMKSLPAGMPPYSHAVVASASSVKKELSPASIFPPGSVEATTFSMRRRRKLLAKDAGSVEAWRLVMALRSGLQAETTWALNSLNILLYDDSSVLYFGLASLPGLLEALVEHWRRALMDLLGGLFVIDEVSNGQQHGFNSTSAESCVDQELLDCYKVDSKDQKRILQSYEKSTSDDPADASMDSSDCVTNYESGLFQRGGGACTEHLKLKMDGRCDEARLKYLSRTCDVSLDQSRNGVEDAERASKRRRLHSTTSLNRSESKVDSDNPSVFFFNSRHYDESDEIEMHSGLPLQVIPTLERQLVDRCLSISNVVRGLSFIPGNEVPMAKHAGLLRVLAELLLMCHKHIDRRTQSLLRNCPGDRSDENGDDAKLDIIDDSSKLDSQAPVDIEDPLWFWDHLMTIVDDAFVILCNLSTQLDLCERSEDVSLPLLNALLHWAACRSPMASDPTAVGAYVSPQRYAIEILCKLSVQERNVDLVLATPPWERIEYLLESLSSMLMLGEDIMVREFAVVLVHALCSASPVACVAAAMRTKMLQQLVIFLEQADANMHQVVQSHGMQMLRDNPELIGTSVGMLRRAAGSLLFMAKLPASHAKFNKYQQRLLHFTMSHLMDSRVAATVAETLFELQKGAEILSSSKPASENNVRLSPAETAAGVSDSAAAADPSEENVDSCSDSKPDSGAADRDEASDPSTSIRENASEPTNNGDVASEPVAGVSSDESQSNNATA